MTTSMHRLQISLQDQQLRYLADCACEMASAWPRWSAGCSKARPKEKPTEPLREACLLEKRGRIIRSAPASPQRSSPAPAGRSLPTLAVEASRAGKPAPIMAQEWLAERLVAGAFAGGEDERARVKQFCACPGCWRNWGRNCAPCDSPDQFGRSSGCAGSPGGKLLSEIILEQRGPKG